MPACVFCKTSLNDGAAAYAACGRNQWKRCTTCAETMAANLERCPKCKAGPGLSPLMMIVGLLLILGAIGAVVQYMATNGGS